MRHWLKALILLTGGLLGGQSVCLATSEVAPQTQDKAQRLAGWFDVFPSLPGFTHQIGTPIGFFKDKIYSQGARYERQDGEFNPIDINLIRNRILSQELKTKALANSHTQEGKIKRYRMWYRTLQDVAAEDRPGRLAQSIFIPLDKDKFVLVEERGTAKSNDLQQIANELNLPKIKRALSRAPRLVADRNVKSFKKIKKGISYNVVKDWLGEPDLDVGSGIHIFVYNASGGNQFMLGFADLDHLLYIKKKRQGYAESHTLGASPPPNTP